MLRLGIRVVRQERLSCANPACAQRNLRDLAFINRWLGGQSSLLGVLHGLIQRGERFSLLDVGAGSGDMGRCVVDNYQGATVVSMDVRDRHLRRASSPRLAGDAFHPPFRPRSFDFVMCSLLLHELPDERATELVSILRAVARRAVIVLELERHPLAYHFLPATRHLLGWSELTVHDGCVSVGSAFRVDELAAIIRNSGVPGALVRRHWPWFRISAVVPA